MFSFVRIALLQFVAVIFSVLFAGLSLKMCFGSGSHYPILATYVRDYGVLLLLIPFVWAIWGMVATIRPKPGLGDADSVIQSGVVLLVALVAFGFISIISPWTRNSLIVHIEPDSGRSNASKSDNL